MWNFTCGKDGCNPVGLIIDGSGALYSVAGGKAGQLSSAKIGAYGVEGNTLASVGESSIVTPGKIGVFYGTEYDGGTNNYGLVYQLSPPAKGTKTWQLTTLFNFAYGAGGSNPDGPRSSTPAARFSARRREAAHRTAV